MPLDYKTIISNLIKALPFINKVILIEEKVDIVFATENWDSTEEIGLIIDKWERLKPQIIMIFGKEYLIRQITPERLIASSTIREGHIVGVKDDKRIIIAQIEPDGIIPFTTMEMSRVLGLLSFQRSYLDEITKPKVEDHLINKTKYQEKRFKREKMIEERNNQKRNQENAGSIEDGVPFTARLMAYYRSQESKRKDPLIIDPLAERLAGDLDSYLKDHIRYSEMDYPIVRSYYVENKYLKPWCNIYTESQIILLGSGLDSRAYRFKPLKLNNHCIFEIDLPSVIHYKEKILQAEQPLCNLVRLSTDLSNLEWISQLIKNGFSNDIPTFWIFEGLVYYMEQEDVASLLANIALMSANSSQLFVDIMHKSRWYPFPYTSDGFSTDPFSRYFKWALNIKDIPSFFATTGWEVSWAFADDYDQGRDVGQKGMVFIHGILPNNSKL